MSSISIKGIVIAALFDFIVLGIVGFIMILIFSKTTGAETAADVQAVYASSPAIALVMAVLNYVASVVVLTAGGYVAAKIARKGPLINGTLSTFVGVLIGLYFVRPEHWISDAITVAGAPLLGLLGGYLYLRRMRNFLQVQP